MPKPNIWDTMDELVIGTSRHDIKVSVYTTIVSGKIHDEVVWRTFCDLIETSPELLKPLLEATHA